ncbi:MAG TPA: hypothetical protein VFN49_10185 [Candidatus Aquilonibacter sp.]|nr:hypothetical protein [Candidatus Aquilonibacter sp.]
MPIAARRAEKLSDIEAFFPRFSAGIDGKRGDFACDSLAGLRVGVRLGEPLLAAVGTSIKEARRNNLSSAIDSPPGFAVGTIADEYD